MTERLFRKRCPWCKQWPQISTNDGSVYWVECDNPDCKVQPVTVAADTQEQAVAHWEERR